MTCLAQIGKTSRWRADQCTLGFERRPCRGGEAAGRSIPARNGSACRCVVAELPSSPFGRVIASGGPPMRKFSLLIAPCLVLPLLAGPRSPSVQRVDSRDRHRHHRRRAARRHGHGQQRGDGLTRATVTNSKGSTRLASCRWAATRWTRSCPGSRRRRAPASSCASPTTSRSTSSSRPATSPRPSTSRPRRRPSKCSAAMSRASSPASRSASCR